MLLNDLLAGALLLLLPAGSVPAVGARPETSLGDDCRESAAPAGGELTGTPGSLWDDFAPALRHRYATGKLRKGHQAGRVRTSSTRLWIEWESYAGIHEKPSWLSEQPVGLRDTHESSDPSLFAAGRHAWRTDVQHLRAEHSPTAVCVVGDDTLVVGGIDPEGRTVIERWSLAWPEDMPGIVEDEATGRTSVELVLPELASVDSLHADDVAGRRVVRNLVEIRIAGARAKEVLVQFHDSGDVHALELTSGRLTSVSSGSRGGRLGPIPALASGAHGALTVRHHRTAGYVYSFGPVVQHRGVPFPPDSTQVILLDGDRDGQIDEHLVLSGPEYLAQRWHILGEYVDWWLD